MRYLRKLMVLAAMAAAAMAIMAPAAVAQEGTATVEVTDKSNQAHCAPTCSAHIVGEAVQLFRHSIFGETHYYTCNNEYTLTTDENGEGTISGFSFTNSPNHSSPRDCTEITECETPWPGHADEVGTDTVHLVGQVCVDTPLGQCEGSFEVALTNLAGPVGGEAEGVPIVGSACEISGHWTDESDSVAIAHTGTE